MPVGIIILLVFIASWAIFRFFHRRALDQIPILENRLVAKDEDISRLKESLAALRAQIGPSVSVNQFAIEHHQSTWYWRVGQEEPQYFVPSVKVPRGTTKVLKIEAKIFAPFLSIEYAQLAIMGEKIQSDWEPLKMEIFGYMSLFFNIPDSVNPGPYEVKLIAGNRNIKQESPVFKIEVPRFNYEDASRLA